MVQIVHILLEVRKVTARMVLQCLIADKKLFRLSMFLEGYKDTSETEKYSPGFSVKLFFIPLVLHLGVIAVLLLPFLAYCVTL